MSKPMTEVGLRSTLKGRLSLSTWMFIYLAVAELRSQLAPATTSAFETQTLEETQMLHRERHRESLYQGFLKVLSDTCDICLLVLQ